MTSILIPDFLNGKNDLCLHGSSVSVNGKAVIFLGHSSAGKSTISRLLSRRYPIIADDKVWVRKNENGGWSTGDASRRIFLKSERTRNNPEILSFPILAFVRIFKSDKTDIHRISTRSLCVHLLDAAFEVDFQRKKQDSAVVKGWFGYLAAMSRNIQGWHLTFRKDITIIRLIQSIFEIRP